MTNNEFGGTLYATSNDMYMAIAETWITADGWNSRADIKQFFDEMTDLELAVEAYECWNLEDRNRNVDVLAWAFSELRKDFPNWLIKT